MDLVAERIRALPPRSRHRPVRLLVRGHEASARTGLLAQRLHLHEKTAWMLRSLLE